jgi:citrate lyase beta subunit
MVPLLLSSQRKNIPEDHYLVVPAVRNVKSSQINKARSLPADSVVLDLEDGVAYDKKDLARDLVVSTLIMEGESTNHHSVLLNYVYN